MTERDPNQPSTPDETPTVAWTPSRDPVAQEAATPTAAQAVRAPGLSGSRLRWGIALAVTVIMLGATAVAIFLLTGQTTPSTVVGYAPADSVIYMELRLDLPGDQRQKLGQFLSRFPGFQDQANLPTKIDESLDRLVGGLTSGQQDFTSDIKPWFEGEVAFVLIELPPASLMTDPYAPPDPSVAGTGRFLILASVSDPAKAEAWLEEVLAGKPTTTANHGGVDLRIIRDRGHSLAVGVDSRVMFIGDEASVSAAIDTGGNSPLASSDRFKAAAGAFDGDGLGFMYANLEAYIDWFVEIAKSMPEAPLGFPFDESQRALIPDWMAARLHARGDAIAFEFAIPHVDIPVEVSNRVSELAPHLPPSTIALVDAHDFGAGIMYSLDLYRKNPATAEAFKQIDQAASLLGGWDGIVGWIQDAGFVLTRDGQRLDGGLVFSPKDRAAAERLLTTLRSYATLGGGSTGLHVEIRDEDYAGAKVTVIDFGDWRDLAALTGADPSAIPFEGRLTLAYTATDEVVAIGLGDAFVKAVLDAGPSLADDGRYRSLIDRVGARNTGSAFVDIGAIREVIEGFIRENPSFFAEYEREYKPYLLPLDAYVQSGTRDGDLDRGLGLVVVR